MKKKTKTLALVKIAIVLCSVFLVALPGIAADQNQEMQKVSTDTITTTASEAEFTLDIYGNANEDDTIDMRDTTYIKLAIFGKKPKTDLADANYDGKVSMLDVGQTKLIILGKEKELWYIDLNDNIVAVHKPVKRIIVAYYSMVEMIRIVGAEDKVVGVDDIIPGYPRYFPVLSKKPCVGYRMDLDVEAILELEPDVVVLGYGSHTPDLEDKLKGTGIDVVRVSTMNIENVLTLGYILDEEENACEYMDWHDDYVATIKERVSEIPEDEKPKVFIDAAYRDKAPGAWTYGGESNPDQSVMTAGGKNIAHDYVTGSIQEVGIEWVIDQNPDVIIGRQYKAGYETDDVSEMRAHYEGILGVPGFDHIKAVKDGRVHMIDSIILWGPAYSVGVAYIAKWLHPDLFEDLDPQAVHQEYIDRFQGIDFDVSEHGVFVYPPLK